MRINMDLLRNILLDVADCPASTVANSHCFTYPQTSQAEINYHIYLLVNQGYLSGIDASSKTDPYYYLNIGLTLTGQSFLDSVSDDTVWKKTKSYMKEHAIELSFKAISFVATHISTT